MNKKTTALGLGIGIVLGIVTALLVAPYKGVETRKKIAQKFTEVKDTVKKKLTDKKVIP